MANEKDVGTLRAYLTLDTSNYEKGSQKAESQTDKLKESLSKATDASEYFKAGFNQLSSTISNLISPAAIVAGGITAIGAAAIETFNVGDKLRATMDDLQVSTGALGESLDDLSQSLENVMWNSSATADKLGVAMGNLNTYLGITGDDLENLTELFSKYSDLTGNDVATATEKASKAFNLWGVETEDMADTLNVFYGISQSTGITIEALFANVTDGASYLKRLGYSIEDAAVELASFEKYGMSASTVLTGMKMAISKMAEQGIEPTKEAWDSLKESIANATTDAEALAIATDAFGSRYAADMVDAIKLVDDAVGGLNGNIDAMKDALDESIANQAFGLDEAWTRLSNRLATGAMKVFDTIEPALIVIVDALATIVEAATWLFDAFKPVIDAILTPIRVALEAVSFTGKEIYDKILVPIYEWCEGFLEFIQPITDFIDGLVKGINSLLGITADEGNESENAMKNAANAVDKATSSMDAYCDSLDSAISKTKELSATSSSGEDPYVNTGMNYHIENGYKIYADGTRVKDGGTIFNNSITVQGGGYATEEMARIYAYNQAMNSLKARY